jgi:uncharacterized pyridoxal phosphate-containing UPF0001 family protein
VQSKKARSLVGIPNLVMVETVDSLKLAKAFNKEVLKQRPAGSTLGVLLQVNTSGEACMCGWVSGYVCSCSMYMYNNILILM